MEKMENKPRERKSLLRIMIVALTIALVIVPWLIYNLYKIQVRDAKTLQNKAIAQQTRDMLVSPVRGAIYDRNMTPLALNATVNTIVISPAEIKDDAEAELTVGVRDGLLHTLELELGGSELLLTMEQTDGGLHFVLSDEEDETSSLTVTLKKTDKGVTLTAEFVGDEFRIQTEDNMILDAWNLMLKRSETPTATLELAFEDGDGLLRVTRNGKVRELHYSTENDGMKLTMQSADGVDFELAVMPYDPIELDTSGAESLLDMTSTELQIFAMKIYTNLSR